MYALIDGLVFLDGSFKKGYGVVINEDKIVDTPKVEELSSDLEKISVDGAYITPGFIDLQLNGCGGVLFNDEPTLDTLEIMNTTNINGGCTSFLPTLITSSDENILKALSLIDSKESFEDIGVLGLHIEGPYISVPKKGIHREKFIRVLSDDIITKITSCGGDKVKILTLAPEVAKGEHIKTFKDSGIKVSLGHTNGTYKEIVEKIPYGVTLGTHLFNGMSSFTHREPGAVGAILNNDIMAGIITDGYHVDFPSIDIAFKVMGTKRLFIVTDAVSPTGTNMDYFIFEGNKVYYRDGKCIGEDGTLGGAAITMIDSLKRVVSNTSITLEEGVTMMTDTPARAISVEDRYGHLKKDYIADIAIFSKDFEIQSMVVKGKFQKI